MDNRQLRNQLRYIEGQLGGVGRMLDQERTTGEVLVQLRAIAAGAQRAVDLVTEGVARAGLRAELERQLAACPGVCERCDEILAVFDALDLGPVVRAATAG